MSPCCAFYLVFDNRDCLVASYNDEHCIWELSGTHQIPDFNSIEGSEEFYYKYVECQLESNSLPGTLLSYTVNEYNLLTIEFSSGLKVALKYNPESENESFELFA